MFEALFGIGQESLDFLPQEELRSIFWDQDIWVHLNQSWLFSPILTESQFVSKGNVWYSSFQKLYALSKQLDFFYFIQLCC